MDGIPVTVKANVAVGKWWMMPHSSSAILNTADSRNNKEEEEGEEVYYYESDIARKLLNDCGAVLIGITNMDEFGMGSLGLNSGLLLHNNNNNDNDIEAKLK